MYNAQECEHEAAHAVVARALGLAVTELRVDRPRSEVGGWCQYRTTGLQTFEHGVVLSAPQLWIERFRTEAYPGGDAHGSRDDQQEATRLVHDISDNIGEALLVRKAIEHKAVTLLREHADDVLTIAARLQRRGVWRLSGGWARPGRRAA